MVTVDNGVTLEVLDWGGTGRAVIFVPGGADTAHVFDQLAPKLTDEGHIYGITPRGVGPSSAPAPPGFDVRLRPDNTYEVTRRNPSEPNAYDADRLGDDVLAVMGQLKLGRPVLIGHSLGGQELSSVGSRHPEKVAGLIYLDALQNSYAFFTGPEDELPFKAPHAWAIGPRPIPDAMLAVFTGIRKYSSLPLPILAIQAFPRKAPPGAESDPAIAARHAAASAKENERLDSLERDIPTARVVRVQYADHYLWRTNESDMLREIGGFLSRLR
jgi:pimeloyl-ACP methyl ester carboxylesterase